MFFFSSSFFFVSEFDQIMKMNFQKGNVTVHCTVYTINFVVMGFSPQFGHKLPTSSQLDEGR
jgi:hypothetical protein